MVQFKFKLKPRKDKKIKINNRTITTKIPVLVSIKILKKLKEFELTNATDQLPVIWDKAYNYNIYDPYGNNGIWRLF